MADTTSAKKILLVEDDQFLSLLLKNRLEKEGLLVTVAGDGEAAFSSMKESRPNLVLLDLILPGSSGFEVLEKMRADIALSAIPTIIISNLGQNEDVARGKELGALEYFVKARTSIDDLVMKAKEAAAAGPPSLGEAGDNQ